MIFLPQRVHAYAVGHAAGLHFRRRRGRLAARAFLLLAGGFGASPRLIAQTGAAPATRWILVYAGGPHRPAYNVDDYVHLLAAVDTAGRPIEWLCTGAVYLEQWAPSGRAFATFDAHPWAVGEDWSTYLDTLFRPGANLSRLDSSVALVAKQAGGLGRPFPISVMIPYPDTALDTLRFGGRTYRLTTADGRVGLIHAWVDSVQARFHQGRYRNLDLHGMYWLQEKAAGADRAVLPAVSAVVHAAGLKFQWIPFYLAAGHESWRTFGFDEVWYQPNYFFHPSVPVLRVDSAMRAADSLHMGAELEFDRRLFTDSPYANRLLPYVVTLWMHPALRRRSIAIFDGAGTLLELSRTRDPRLWDLYTSFVQVVTDTAGPPRAPPH
jgi:hypothetical protein